MDSIDHELLLIIVNNLYPHNVFKLSNLNHNFKKFIDSKFFRQYYKYYNLGIGLRSLWVNYYLPYKIIKTGNYLFKNDKSIPLFSNAYNTCTVFEHKLMEIVIKTNSIDLCKKYMKEYNIKSSWDLVQISIDSKYNDIIIFLLSKLTKSKDYINQLNKYLNLAIEQRNYELIIGLIS